MAVIESTRIEKAWKGFYDFAVDGGAVGTITLRSNDGPIPNAAVVTSGYLNVLTSCLSGTGTMAVNVEGAADTLTATAQAGLTAGVKSVIEAATGATAVRTTAARSPALVIATAPFTAGKFELVLEYT